MLFPVDPATLADSQRDGWACVVCARDLLAADDPGVSVGAGLLACTSCVTAYVRGVADATCRAGSMRRLLRTAVVALTGATRRGCG
jgi:hypothetical protein